jgi:hypothetical protein
MSRFELNILEFQRDPQPEEFLDSVLVVEKVFEFNRIPDERRVSLVVYTFRERVAAWWQLLKQSRMRQGLFIERRTHGRQHFAQAHDNQRMSRFELNILEFQRDPQP